MLDKTIAFCYTYVVMKFFDFYKRRILWNTNMCMQFVKKIL
jgi:hypothetical protein